MTTINYRIEEKEAFRVVGIKQWFSTINNEQMNGIPLMWENTPSELFQQLKELSKTHEVVGLCADMYNDGFDYWIGSITEQQCPHNMNEKSIPSTTWAIFEAIGPMPHAMQNIWGMIYSEWLPNSGYKHAELPEVEYYTNGDKASETYRSEIWIPVVKI